MQNTSWTIFDRGIVVISTASGYVHAEKVKLAAGGHRSPSNGPRSVVQAAFGQTLAPRISSQTAINRSPRAAKNP